MTRLDQKKFKREEYTTFHIPRVLVYTFETLKTILDVCVKQWLIFITFRILFIIEFLHFQKVLYLLSNTRISVWDSDPISTYDSSQTFMSI